MYLQYNMYEPKCVKSTLNSRSKAQLLSSSDGHVRNFQDIILIS